MSSQARSFLASPEGLELLQAAKAERGLTFAAIAEKAGVSADTVSRLFHRSRGKRVSGESVRAIARMLELGPDAIVPEGEWPNPMIEAVQGNLKLPQHSLEKILFYFSVFLFQKILYLVLF